MDIKLLISKLLPLLVMPVGAACLLLILGLLAQLLGARKTGFLFSAVALGLIVLAAMPITAERLGKPLESMYPALVAAQAPAADAIVALGGGVEIPVPPRQTPELNSSGDRIIEASRLYRAGRAPVLLLSGGNVYAPDSWPAESTYSAELVAFFGVDPEAVVVESVSQTTYENAIESRRFLKKRGIRRVLLVTSALHMPRAVATFESAGIEVLAAPTDYLFTDWVQPPVFRYLPNAAALSRTSRVLHEYLGFFIYRWRGWISTDYGYRPESSDSALASTQSASS